MGGGLRRWTAGCRETAASLGTNALCMCVWRLSSIKLLSRNLHPLVDIAIQFIVEWTSPFLD